MKNLIHLLAILSVLFLFSCEKEDDECKGDASPNRACIEIYAPVCGCDNETYSNSCYADVAGVLRWTEGVCP